MVIPEQQLQTWSSPPSPTEMEKIKRTREIIEAALRKQLPIEEIKRSYQLEYFKYEVYLQGSYANSTNVRFDSDVDIVVQLDSVFKSDTSALDALQKGIYDLKHKTSLYDFKQLKKDVYEALLREFGAGQVGWNNKCLNIPQNTNRVDADVVPCLQYRIYKRFLSYTDQHFVEGMRFYDTSNDTEIINYPKKHLENCESKNIDTEGKFKDLVRIYKNMRNKLVENGQLDEKSAPSYFIENLLYNCSSPCFDGNYTNCMVGSLQFILDAIDSGRITGFICANEQDTLISAKTWNLDDLIKFVNAIVNYYLGKIVL